MPGKAAKKPASSKAEPKSETPTPAETVEATKPAGETGTERKKSEKAAERKPSESVAASPAAAEASVDSLTAKVADLQVAKPAASAKKSGGKKSEKGDEAGSPVSVASPTTETPKTDAKSKKGGAKAASDDPPKAAEAVKSSEVSKAEASADAGTDKASARKNSERKQSTKATETPKAETKTDEPVKIHAAGGGKKLKILAICGSLRKASFNLGLLKMAQQTAPANVEIVISDISGLPFFNQDTEYEPNPAVAKFKAEIAAADAILFATPEYNYSIPGVLKNAIDVASRPWGQNSWANKPTGLWSASVGGFGGLRAQLALRQSAVFLKLNIYPGDEFLVSNAGAKFDANGLTDADTQAKLTAWISSFSKWVQELPLIPLQ